MQVPTSVTSSPTKNIELLRALAIVSVLIHHIQAHFGGNVPFLGDYGGQFGPQLFFVISGYLICSSCAKYTTRDYFIQRAFRILPAYWFYFLLVALANGLLAPSALQGDKPLDLAINLLLLQQLFPHALLSFDVLHVTWTLTVELLWYLSVPLLLLCFGTISGRLAVVATVVSTVFVYLASRGHLNFLMPADLAAVWRWRYFFLDNSFLGQLCFFVYGGYIYFQQDMLRALNPLVLFAWCVVIFLALPFYIGFNPIFITGLGIACLFVACLNCPPVSSRVVHFISETSFSIYLSHITVLLFVRDQWGLAGPLGVLVGTALTLLVSAITYRWVEQPAMRWGRRLTRKPGTPVGPQPVVLPALPALPVLPVLTPAVNTPLPSPVQ